MHLFSACGTSLLPHPATNMILPLGGRVRENARAASKCDLPRISKSLSANLKRDANPAGSKPDGLYIDPLISNTSKRLNS